MKFYFRHRSNLFFKSLILTLLWVHVMISYSYGQEATKPSPGKKQDILGIGGYFRFAGNDIAKVIQWRPNATNINWKKVAFWSSSIVYFSLFEKNLSNNVRAVGENEVLRTTRFIEPLGRNKRLVMVGISGLAASTLLQNRHGMAAAFTFLEGIIITEGAVRVLKAVFGRARPIERISNSVFESGRHSSLPSGHTTMAFTAASIASEYYPHLRKYFYTAATGVGLHRISSNAHWVTDVIAGVLLGHYAGKFFARSHLELTPEFVSGKQFGISTKLIFH